MKKIFAFLAIVAASSLSAAVAAAQEAPVADTAKVPSFWTKGLTTEVGFSQVSLTNWAAGGQGSIALNTYVDTYANYKKNRYIWENELQMGYGFIQQFDGTKLKKSDDRIILDSKFGYQASKKLYLSAIFNFRSQFANGYNYEKELEDHTYPLTSRAFAPAYFSLGLGLEYKPMDWLSINFAPLTEKVVLVGVEELRESYGIDPDKSARFDLGAQLKINARKEIKNFKIGSDMTFFSNYLDKPLDIKVNWDFFVEAKVSNYFSVNLRTELIYDSTIKSKLKRDDNGEVIVDPISGEEVKVAGVQFKELFSVGFAYTFGVRK